MLRPRSLESLAIGLILGIGLGICLVPLLAFAAEPPQEIPRELSSLRLLALEAVAGHGVVRSPDGKLTLVSEGDLLPGTEASVEEVLEDRLVLRLPDDLDPSLWQLIWMSPAEGDEAKSRFRILDPVPPEEDPVEKPASSEEDSLEIRPEEPPASTEEAKESDP